MYTRLMTKMAAKVTKIGQGQSNLKASKIIVLHTICENLVILGIIERELFCTQGS